MWIAKIALQRSYTFVVLALLILLLGVLTTLRIPVDIFPSINIPVVVAIWGYTGLSARVTPFDGGRRHAQTDQARAAYDEQVANYRATVGTAYREVEDWLADLGQLLKRANWRAI
ncbi:MAG: acriflavin resistance protein [Gammaproteobacteria bacterium]|nr:acriflavin resistance protein [Gammaproteobacteria bacterium]